MCKKKINIQCRIPKSASVIKYVSTKQKIFVNIIYKVKKNFIEL